MKGNRYALVIERFVLRAADPSDRLELDGWLATDAAIGSARLDLPGQTALDVTCEPEGDRHRLRLCAPAADSPALDGAALVITSRTDCLFVEVGHLLRRPGWWPRLVRFAPDPEGLPLTPLEAGGVAEAIADGPPGDDPADLHLSLQDGRWTAVSHRYALRLAAQIDAPPIDAVPDRHAARALAWTTMRDALAALIAALDAGALDGGAPLLVYRRGTGDTDETMRSLFERLRARNPDAALLWLDPHRACGPVVRWRDEPWAERGLLLLASDADAPHTVLAAAREHMLAPRIPR